MKKSLITRQVWVVIFAVLTLGVLISVSYFEQDSVGGISKNIYDRFTGRVVENSSLEDVLVGEDVDFDNVSEEEIELDVGDNVQEIPISISTQETLFDVLATVIDDKIQDSGDLRIQIDLLPAGEEGVDVTIRYTIKDLEEVVYHESSEDFYASGPMSFVREFPTENLVKGSYVFDMEMVYLDEVVLASPQFEVIDESIFGNFEFTTGVMILTGVVLVVVVVGVVLLFRLKKGRKAGRKKKKK